MKRGKNKQISRISRLGIYLLIGLLSACKGNDAVQVALDLAGENRTELLRVITHYEKVDNKEPLKLQAARFLIGNMPGHHSLRSEAIDEMQARVYQSDTPVPMDSINTWWQELSRYHSQQIEHDVHTLKADFLIANIDQAFDAWKASPWKEEVDFDAFCRYILPYRFQNELLAEGWRDSLYREYHPLIAEVKELPRAFAIVQKKVWSQVNSSSSKFPHVMQVLAVRHQAKATCIQRCILLGSVLRSLGIPAAIDSNRGRWANYSMSGHAWLSVVTPEGVLTVAAKDSVARLNNEIDSSTFPLSVPEEEDYPVTTDFKKRCACIGRYTYEHNAVPKELDREWRAALPLSDPFCRDVSREYHLTGAVEVEVDYPTDHAYLCTFATGKDWEPVAFGKVSKGKCRFANLGDSAAYAVMVYHRGKIIPVGHPFLLLNHRMVVLQPDPTVQRTVTLNRKYPLAKNWFNVLAWMKGGRWEASNRADFAQKETLLTLERMPRFQNETLFPAPKAYRYVRYVSPPQCNNPISEIACYAGDSLLRGNSFGTGCKATQRCFDGDTYTFLSEANNGFIVGTDFGKAVPLTRLVYYPKNDGNFIVPTHEYELLYFDKKWISLGRKKSQGVELTYDQVPDQAILLLKNRTTGQEERIFTYEHGKQVWW